MKDAFLRVIAICGAFLFSNALYAQAPSLGAAADFALFTAAGAFSNIGAGTIVSGNVGTQAGAYSAFPPGTLNGVAHVVDAISFQAAADVATAYGAVSTVTCDTVIGTTLGSGQTLGPRVYCLGAASTLNGTLILDGQSNPNSLFIFKINGAFATGSGANVVLINGASLCNVYWQVNGAFSLGTGSVFRGTLLVNGAISLLEGSTLMGRGLSTAGAIDLHTNTVTLLTQLTSTISASGSTTICAGNSVTLNANVTGGIAPITYLWSPGAQTSSSITVSPASNTTYSVSVSPSNSCAPSTASQLITVKQSASHTQNATICQNASYTLPWGQVAFASGDYTNHYTAANGCDSVFTLHLNVLQAITVSSTVNICQGTVLALAWGINAYTTGEYAHTFTSSAGCDSTVVIHLNVKPTYSFRSNVLACNGVVYTLPWGATATVSGAYTHKYTTVSGCDSLVTIQLTLDKSTTTTSVCLACFGASYTLPWGDVVTSAGDYSHAFPATIGCDRIETVKVRFLPACGN